MRVGHVVAQVVVEAAQDLVAAVEQGHLGAEAVHDRRRTRRRHSRRRRSPCAPAARSSSNISFEVIAELGAGDVGHDRAARRWRSGDAWRHTPRRSRAAPGAGRRRVARAPQSCTPARRRRVVVDRLEPGDLGVLGGDQRRPVEARRPDASSRSPRRPRRRRRSRWHRPSASSARSRGSRRCRRSGTPRRAPTRAPASAATRAARTPPEPPPITKRSKSKPATRRSRVLVAHLLGDVHRLGAAAAAQQHLGRRRRRGRSPPRCAMPMKSPCSTTPGIAFSAAASAGGSPIRPRCRSRM